MKNLETPFSLFGEWYQEALRLPVSTPSAMVLTTASKDGLPSARIVLLKDWDDNGFVFFTNYGSRKAKEMEVNPRASLLFYWEPLARQIRIEGRVERISFERSRQYFKSRPKESQLGAWASKQSQLLPDQEVLEDRYAGFKEKYSDEIPLPDFWGGYCLIPNNFEFWQDAERRLHHRRVYEKKDHQWQSHLLYP